MLAYECPSCGAPVSFASSATVFAVCAHCRSMVVRNDKKLEAIGVIADLLPDMSPLQIGTRGRWRKQEFTLLGRVRLAWAEGSWTEWYLELGGGRQGWLAEAQGFFAISFLNNSAPLPKNPRALAAGSSLTIGEDTWRVMDGKDVRYAAAEGELPLIPTPGTERYSVDLAGSDRRFGSIEISSGEQSFFEGETLEFSDLAFENLREVPGWSNTAPIAARPAARTVRCPHCAAVVDLRASGLSLSVVCGSCQTILDPATSEVAIIQRAEAVQQEIAPVLPLGIRGQFSGLTYEVIGCMVRADTYASWSEYLLFNPWQGFRWLVTYRGHWSLVDRLLAPPTSISNEIQLPDGHLYRLFARSKTEVRAVIGEFYWQVQRGEISEAADYISPPHILSQETYPTFTEETWSVGTYLPPSAIVEAFALPEKLPSPQGSYLNEPNPYQEKWKRVRVPAVLAVGLLFVVQTIFTLAQPERILLNQRFDVAPAPIATEVSTTNFVLSGRSQPVHVDLSAPLNNSWIDVDAQLVNAVTGEVQTAETELSFYSGYDADGAWTEGDRTRTLDFAATPAGTYFLRLEPSIDAKSSTVPLSITVQAGGIFWSNFVTSLLLLALYPTWIFYRRYAFERDRWSESDFSMPSSLPVSTSDDSE